MQNRKPRVFFVMSTNDYSGAEAVNFSIIKNLRDKYDFCWVSREGKINERLREENIEWIKINKLSIKELRSVIRKYKPDILHATDYTASVICAPFYKKVHVISHLHNNSPWIRKKCAYSYLYKYAAKRVDKILVVSNSIIDEYVFADCFMDKMINVGNPVSRRDILMKVDGCRNKKFDICCVARIAPQKNPKRFLDIVFELKKNNDSIKAVWVGKGEIEAEVKKYASELGLDGNVLFAGYQKNPWSYMAESKIFMLTSDYEGYGLVAFEAMTLGLPCVVSRVGGLPGIVTDNCGKACGSKEEFIKECQCLLNNESYYSKKSQEAIMQSVKLDNIGKYNERVSDIYKEIYEKQK